MFRPISLILVIVSFGLLPNATWAQKQELYKSIHARDEATWSAAMKIWGWAEPGYQEQKSCKLLADMLKEAGFSIEKGVAKIPTAFIASFGKGKPIIGILGEFDALPGLSQEPVPYRQPKEGMTYGHGCGHHLFGTASASAAIAIAEQIQAGKLQGTIRFYGCPAEEGGSAKAFMVRAGLFKDCATVLHWHPGNQNSAGDKSTLARIAVKFRFHGKASHAAGAPEQGRSALDAVELTNFAAQLLREHTPESTRIHHIITAGGDAPNIVPAFAEVYYYVRHPKSTVVRSLYQRLLLCAQAGALATQTKLEVDYQGGIMEIFPNNVLAQVAKANLTALNDLQYTAEDTRFALKLSDTLDNPQPISHINKVFDKSGTISMGSTDVGDVSWVVPTTGFGTACWVPGTPGHSWQAVAAGGTSIARQGMNLAARVLAATAWDLLSNPNIMKQAKEEHTRRLGGKKYNPLIQAEQKPPLNYRRPPKK